MFPSLKASRVSYGYNPISSLETIDGIVEPIFVDKRAHARAAFHRLPVHWLTSGQKAPRPVLEKPVKPQPLKKARTKWLSVDKVSVNPTKAWDEQKKAENGGRRTFGCESGCCLPFGDVVAMENYSHGPQDKLAPTHRGRESSCYSICTSSETLDVPCDVSTFSTIFQSQRSA